MKINKIGLFVSTAVVLLIFLLLVYSASHKYGRLASVPFYDECTYFYSGAMIVDAVRTKGLINTLSNFDDLPLHSPYNVLVSAIVLSGSNFDTQFIYYSGVLVVLALIWMLFTASKTNDYLICFLLICISLLWPVCTIAACEFRPDSLWGILLALIATLVIVPEKSVFEKSYGLLVGICFAAGLLIKPTAFPLTVVVYSVAIGLRFFHESVFSAKMPIRKAMVFTLVSILTCLFVSFPYIYFHGYKIWAYFYDNVLGASAGMWEPSTNYIDKFLYYISGPGAISAYGVASYFQVVIAFGAIFLIFYWGSNNLRSRAGLFILMLLICYVVISLGNIKSVFLGSPFYFMLIAVSIFCISSCYDICHQKYGNGFRKISSIVLSILIITGIVLFKWPEICFVHPSLAAFRITAHKTLSEVIDKNRPDNSIYFLRHGPVHPENIGTELIKMGVDAKITDSGRTPPQSVDEFMMQASGSKIVVIADDEIVGHQTMIPIGSVYSDIDLYLKTSPSFKLVKELKDYRGKKMSIFEKL